MIPAILLLLSLPIAQPPDKPAATPAATTPTTPAKPEAAKANPLASLKLRGIGPALMSGRVVGFAVHPADRSKFFVAVACGGVWKTANAGVSWTPVFDGEGSYSIGCVVLDPKDPNVVWVGSGENNSQRSVGYGDGVYKSIDGGRTWQNVGLKASEHIAKILIDPRDSDIVYVAAQGPLWGPGGDRGLYKTTDGGKTWNRILNISENTGITDVVQDPRHPDVLVAASYQRRRHVYTIIDGGPECALHRTTDGGKTWTKLKSGLPTAEMGRIGLAAAPTDPDTIYAIIEAADKQGGIFRSTDRGVTWEKRNPSESQAQYYAHLVVDPRNKDRVYVMNVVIQVSDDGGKTFTRLGGKWAHVDNHEIWIDPRQPDYYRVGCDGGIYESFDRGANWRFLSNLPVTQFYDADCEQTDTPFYRVYGGTQDNNSQGGPARTPSVHGITNADWHSLVGGDGFHCKVDPKDPDTVYAEYQYGGLARFDWRTQQRLSIQPHPGAGEPSPRWNWDSPLVVSPHQHTRLYFAANRVYRSDDRGDSWKPISGDLTRQINRDQLPVFNKIQPPDAVFKHASTSLFGNITALAESPRAEGLLYAGTDDGLIQVTEDAGTAWRKIDKFPGVPDMTYVARVLASQHDAGTVYAAFDNHKNADFKPYLLKSSDRGQNWVSIAGDLPERGSVLALAEDHVNPNLLFAGTEFGLYFTIDGGKKWHRLKSGLPTIAVRDVCIQRAMNDLVVATFGRGFYVLDDYSPLRSATKEELEKPATVFPIRDAALYMQTAQYGGRGKAFLGEAFYSADNPPFGATFTFHLKEALQSRKQKRKEAEKKPNFTYPSQEQLRAEAEEEEPAVLVTVLNAAGTPIRTFTAPASAGVHRATWDLRLPSVTLPRPANPDADEDFFGPPSGGPLVAPGKYAVQLSKRVDGVVMPLAGPVEFSVKYVGPQPPTPADLKDLAAFQKDVVRLQRDVNAAEAVAQELTARLNQMKLGLDQTPDAPAAAREKVRKVIAAQRDTVRLLTGDAILRARQENVPMSIAERVGVAADAARSAIARPTGTQREQYAIARKELDEVSEALRKRLDTDVKELEKLLDKLGAPYTPGRLPGGK
ncbi:MAG: VPS10 domain-containing protein [Gemmataceae bacterium]